MTLEEIARLRELVEQRKRGEVGHAFVAAAAYDALVPLLDALEAAEKDRASAEIRAQIARRIATRIEETAEAAGVPPLLGGDPEIRALIAQQFDMADPELHEFMEKVRDRYPPHTPDARPRLCVAAIVTDPLGRVLLVRSRRREGWELPGGKVKRGETWLEAMDREVLEETAMAVYERGQIDLIHAGTADGLTCDTLVIVAWCRAGRPCGRGPQPGGDALEAQWFAPDALPELANLPTARLLCEWAGAW